MKKLIFSILILSIISSIIFSQDTLSFIEVYKDDYGNKYVIHYYEKLGKKLAYLYSEYYDNYSQYYDFYHLDTLTLISKGKLSRANRGKKDKWIYYYDNGEISSEGNYKAIDWGHGLSARKDGKWTYYHENGQISSEGKYIDGQKDGKWTYYYENGQIQEEGNHNHKSRRRDGKWTYYNEDGSIDKVEEWKDGIEAKVAKAKADAKKTTAMKKYNDKLDKIEAEIKEVERLINSRKNIEKLEELDAEKTAHIRTKPK